MVSVVENGHGDTSSNPGFHIALIPLGKVWIQLFSVGKIVGKTMFFSLGEATSLGEGKLWIQTC